MSHTTDTAARVIERVAQLRSQGREDEARHLEREAAYWQGIADFERFGLPLLGA